MDRVRGHLHGDWGGAIVTAGEAVLETATWNSSVRSGGRLSFTVEKPNHF